MKGKILTLNENLQPHQLVLSGQMCGSLPRQRHFLPHLAMANLLFSVTGAITNANAVARIARCFGQREEREGCFIPFMYLASCASVGMWTRVCLVVQAHLPGQHFVFMLTFPKIQSKLWRPSDLRSKFNRLIGRKCCHVLCLARPETYCAT